MLWIAAATGFRCTAESLLLHHDRVLDIEDRGVLHRRAQDANGALDKRTTPGVFLGRRACRVPKRVVELPAAYDAIGSHARGNSNQTGGQHGWNADALTRFGDRSTATRAGASRRG